MSREPIRVTENAEAAGLPDLVEAPAAGCVLVRIDAGRHVDCLHLCPVRFTREEFVHAEASPEVHHMDRVFRGMDLFSREHAEIQVNPFEGTLCLKRGLILPVIGQGHEVEADPTARAHDVPRRLLAVGPVAVNVRISLVGLAGEQVLFEGVDPEVPDDLRALIAPLFHQEDVLLFILEVLRNA